MPRRASNLEVSPLNRVQDRSRPGCHYPAEALRLGWPRSSLSLGQVACTALLGWREDRPLTGSRPAQCIGLKFDAGLAWLARSITVLQLLGQLPPLGEFSRTGWLKEW